jgi:hypothetical protein
VIQKTAIVGSLATTVTLINGTANTGTQYLTYNVVPKSIASTFIIAFTGGGGDTSGAGIGTNIQVGSTIICSSRNLASTASIGKYSISSSGIYQNTTGAGFTVTVWFGPELGASTATIYENSLLTIEEII